MNCSFCGSETSFVHDFGEVALAGGFLKPPFNEKKYPLKIHFCEECYLLQVEERIDPDVMFKEYFYFSSANETMTNHFKSYADEIVKRFNPKKVIEIGCNDGVLLNPLINHGVECIGVDPSSTVPQEDYIVNDYFTEEVARKLGKADLVIANNVFAHIDDINCATRAVYEALKDDGTFIMEVHYLGDMIYSLQYDWIYHEHIYYYSLMTLDKHFRRHGMKVYDIKKVNTHGGSMRYYICKDGRKVSREVRDQFYIEKSLRLDKLDTYKDFSERIKKHKKELKEALPGKIVGYGASGRANAVIQYCDLQMDYMVDDAPAKEGFYTPGSHIPIYSREKLEQDPPERVLVFAWGYLDEIKKKCHLPMVIPFPIIKLEENHD